MSIKLADSLVPMSNDFYAVESENVGIDIDGTSKSIQQAYEDGDLSSGGSSIQVDTMPIASAENENMIVEYVGASGTYQNGYFYQNIGSGDPKVYSWVQKNVQPSNATATDVSYDDTTSELVATNVQDAIDEIKGGLGTASGKNFTDLVRPNSHELVESGSVYSAINNALSSIYTPRGELTCAELTSSLLIEDNVGNIYTMSDSGTTSALFINGAGQTINVNDNVGIIKAGANTYLFNLMGDAFDLHDYQKKELTTPILGEDTVEGALGVIAEKDKRIWIGHKADWDLLTTAEKTEYDEAHFDDDNSATELPPDVYSTTETKTNKVWIDGKPIYRKVINLSSDLHLDVNTWTEITQIPKATIERVINLTGWSSSELGYYTFSIGAKMGTTYIEAMSYVGMLIKTFAIEYTKTTD